MMAPELVSWNTIVSLFEVYLTRVSGKGLQSRSATASLLIKSIKCVKEETKVVVVLAQESRHIVDVLVNLQDETETHKS